MPGTSAGSARGPGRRSAPQSARLAEQAVSAFALLTARAGSSGATRSPAETLRLHRALVDLLLRTILLACAEDFGVIEAASPSWRDPGSDPPEIRRLLEGQWERFRSRGASGAREGSFGGDIDGLDDRTLASIVHALTSIDGARISYAELDVEDLGRVYEGLLDVELETIDATAVCLKPDGVWVRVRDILDQEPDIRAKWVQRTAGLPKTSVQRLAPALTLAKTELEVVECLDRFRKPSTSVATRGRLVLQRATGRRRSGSHYTPRTLTAKVVSRSLAPLVEGRDSRDLLELAICDPAMGAGAFLVEVCRYLSEHLLDRWRRESRPEHRAPNAERLAFRAVVEHVIYGVDKNPVAVDLARSVLSILAAIHGAPFVDLTERLVVGDALVERPLGLPDDEAHLVWRERFASVFDRRKGFDAFVGNPPWVAFAGRAAQPIDERLAAYFRSRTRAFSGYPTLHGLFVWRAASLLNPGGRLGLVLPTSVSDLAGYAPTRRAHDALSEPDADLIDFGDGAFAGVFQPCMALTSTRRPAMIPIERDSPRLWSIERPDLDSLDRALLAKLGRLPRLPAELFGERGFQSTGDDLSHLRVLTTAEPPFTQAVREGADIGEFCVRPPTLFLDPRRVAGRFRPQDDWASVKLLIRQTARYPIAGLGDGVPFRNSILAGFSDRRWSEHALLCYLNSNVIRWFHYFQHRDARQGMPQLKIGHLRSLPDLPRSHPHVLDALDGLGRQLGPKNRGIETHERDELDDLVATALGLTAEERERVRRFAEENPPPIPRRRDRDAP